MKKKTICLVIICLLAIMSLTACESTSTGKPEKERDRVTEAFEEFSSSGSENILNDEEVFLLEEETTMSTSSTTETAGSNTNSNQQMLEYLDNQVKSSNPDNWIEVAKCEKVTPDHLLQIAEKCVRLHKIDGDPLKAENKQIEIANALSENSITTEDVMWELAGSEFPSIWKIVASSGKSDESTLLSVATECVQLHMIDGDPLKAKNKQIEIANALSENSITTEDVMWELTESEFSEVVLIGYQWIQQH